MLYSECCDANAYFSLGYAHGIYLESGSNEYTGICSECKEHSVFIDDKENK